MEERVLASIITIGDELLIGQVIDSNSAWMAQQLNRAGIWVKRRVAVGDTAADIRAALDQESREADIILLTGGLGPTADDITKPLLCAYFGGKMITDENVKAHVIHLFHKVFKRPGPMLERNLKQAEVPDNCTVLHNERGTAPGMWFEKEGKIFVSMPGVPYEMQGLMEQEVIPRLTRRFTVPAIESATLLTFGIGESMIAERLTDFEAALPAPLKLAYLPNYGMVRLRLTGSSADGSGLRSLLAGQFSRLKELIGDVLVTDTDAPMEKIVGRLLLDAGKTMSTAESCTGGLHCPLHHSASRVEHLVQGQRGELCQRGKGTAAWCSARIFHHRGCGQ